MNAQTTIVKSLIDENIGYWEGVVSDIPREILIGQLKSYFTGGSGSIRTSFETEALIFFREKINWEELADYLTVKLEVKHLSGFNESGEYRVVDSNGNFKVGEIIEVGYHEHYVSVRFQDRGRNSNRTYYNGKIPVVSIKAINKVIHLKDAKDGRDYKVIQSYSVRHKNGDTVGILRYENYVLVNGIKYYNSSIPDVWLEKC